MLSLVADAPGRRRSVLCLGAHADDIEIGCGGTLLRMQSPDVELDVKWVVFSAAGDRRQESRDSVRRLFDDPSAVDVDIHDFRDAYFPDDWAAIKDVFEELKRDVSPDLVFTPRRDDAHQDHRTIGRLTWNTFRDHLILEYEIPKYDGDLDPPNVYSPLDPGLAEAKLNHLMTSFPSQHERPWYTEETFRSLLRLRGVECAERYAEAFHVSKAVVAWNG